MINLGNIKISDLRLGASQVKAVYLGSEQVWGGEQPGPTADWLCFTAEQDGSTLRLDKVGSPAEIYLETSMDGNTWTDYSWTDSTGDTLTLANVGDKVYFRAKTENQTIGSSSTNYYKFEMSGKIAASGNIQTLLKADGSRTDAPAYCYKSMFSGCTSLTQAPALPATTLATWCYASMFYNCTSLKSAPELPATTLAISCYFKMFDGCSSLTSAPELPATTLANYCYANMFKNCTSLTTAPELPATTLAIRCYETMFNGCSNLNTIKLAYTGNFVDAPTGAFNNWVSGVASTGTFYYNGTDTKTGTSAIPTGWTVLPIPLPRQELCFTAEEANSTVRLDKVGSPNAISLETSTDGNTWTDYSWSGNTGDTLTLANVGEKVYFRAKTENQTIGSSSTNYYKFVMSGKIAASGNIQTLLKADGSRTDAPNNCYQSMFSGCTSLTQAPVLPATTLANWCYNEMFNGCTSLITAPELPATTLANNCYHAMFKDCSSLTTAPALPATTLIGACYRNMFNGCTSLTTAPELPATTLVVSCYNSMFKDCSSLTTAPALPATTLDNFCYQYMFQNCSSLTSAPKLPAITLANYCYNNMFNGCIKLSSIDVRFTSWNTTNATTNWLNNVAASGTFTCPAELPDTRGASNIPEGWTKVDSGYPKSNLLMHFDGIDNTGAGDASHSTDTQTWANLDGSLTGYYLKRPSKTYNTSWDSKGAVLSGEYDQAFWLTDPQGSTVNALSSVDTGSFTYALAFYYDPSTIAQWRGLIGRQGHSNSIYGFNSYAYVCTNPNPYGIKMDICFGKDGSTSNQQGGQDLRSYLTENSFNTIAFAYDESADTLKSFVNGQLVDTTNLSSHPPYASDVVFVLGSGAQSTGSNRTCIGKIYDFMMYSEAITDADVAKIHNWQSTRFNA